MTDEAMVEDKLRQMFFADIKRLGPEGPTLERLWQLKRIADKLAEIRDAVEGSPGAADVTAHGVQGIRVELKRIADMVNTRWR